MKSSGNIVFLSGINWNFLQMRHHHLAQALAERWNVLFVNGPMGPGVKERKTSNQNIIVEPNGKLTVYSPLSTRGSINRFKGLGRFLKSISDSILAKYIRNNFPDAILWCTRPEDIKWLGLLGEKLICYDCLDDYAAFDDIGAAKKKELLRMEEELASKADVVFATAQNLYDRMSAFNSNTYLLKNGTDFNHFKRASEKLEVPAELRNIIRPIVGYIGVVAYWLDYRLIEYLVEQNPDMSFVFVGPISVDLSKFDKYGNIFFLSKKEYDELPFYLSCFDACIIPFQINQVTKSTDPIKAYEYLSTGKPVTSTPLPELAKYQNVIKICQLKEDFNEQLRETLTNDDPNLKNERIKIARENSWAKRAEILNDALDETLLKKS